MLVKLRCKSCFAKVAADDDVIGKEVNCPSCQALFFIPKPQFGFGKVLGGYEIEQFLGSGAMGEVYMARQISMNRPVALKVIKHDISMDREVVDRFTYEAQTLARLNHTNIVPAFDAGHTDECYYMAMGYIDGETLEDKLKRKGPMDEVELIKISLKVIDALEYAWNEFKLLHRDIKPANIMIDQMGEVRLMDMGIAKNTTEDGGLTRPGLVVGTPFFMSPEQAQASAAIDYKSDVYALAASMYQMVTGILPFQGQNVMAILAKKVNAPVAAPHEIKSYVSKELSSLILKLLHYDPIERFSDFDELKNSLKECLKIAKKNKKKESNVVRTKFMKVPDEVLQHIETEEMAKSQNVKALKKNKSIGLIVALIVLIFGLGLTLALVDTKGDEEKEELVVEELEVKKPKKILANNAALTEMFAEEDGGKTEQRRIKLRPRDFVAEHLKYQIRMKGKVGYDSLKSVGSVSFNKYGALAMRQGAFVDSNLKDEFHKSFVDSKGFTFFVIAKMNGEYNNEGVIFCYGKDHENFNVKLQIIDGEVFFLARKFIKAKPEILKYKICDVSDSPKTLTVSYTSGKLLIYETREKRHEIDGMTSLMSDWLNYPITFGDHFSGEHSYYRGDIYTFMMLDAFMPETQLSHINEFISKGLSKKMRRE